MATETPKLPVQGYEEAVRALRGKLQFLKQLTDEVNAAKASFRAAAKQMVAQLPAGCTTLEFLDPQGGGSLVVALADAAKAANRNNIKPEVLAEFANKGLDLTQYTEVEESIVLTGEYLVWLRQLLTSWAEQGVALPESGLTEKRVTRLSAAGVDKLRELAAAGGELALDVLDRCLKAANVSAR